VWRLRNGARGVVRSVVTVVVVVLVNEAGKIASELVTGTNLHRLKAA